MTVALLVTSLLAFAGVVPPPPAAPTRVFLRAPDDLVRGAIAIALIDEGIAVSADPATATHEVTIAKDGDAYVVTCVGLDARGVNVSAGTPALVELELQHRVASLALATPPRESVAPQPGVAPQLVDKAGKRFNDAVAAALLDAGVSLAPPEYASARLCIDAGSDTVTVSWGATPDRCDGRPVGVDRRDLVARVLVGEALRLQDAAPLVLAAPRASVVTESLSPSLPATRAPRATTSDPTPTDAPSEAAAAPTAPTSDAAKTPSVSAPASEVANTGPPTSGASIGDTIGGTVPARAAPIALAGRVGALGRLDPLGGDGSVDPWLEAAALFPLWRGIGVAAIAGGTATTSPLLIGESLVGVGAGGSWALNEWLQADAAVVAGAWVQGWQFDASDAGVTVDPVAEATAGLDVQLTSWLSGSVGVFAGGSRRDRIHRIQGVAVWSRSAVFAGISGGLTFDIAAGP